MLMDLALRRVHADESPDLKTLSSSCKTARCSRYHARLSVIAPSMADISATVVNPGSTRCTCEWYKGFRGKSYLRC